MKKNNERKYMKKLKCCLIFTTSIFVLALSIKDFEVNAKSVQSAKFPNRQFSANGKYISLEILSDDIIHIETAQGSILDSQTPIYTTPMISKDIPFKGPTSFIQNGNKIETANLIINVDKNTLCISYFNKKLNYNLANICPINLENPTKSLQINSSQNKNAYGLGQYFYDPNLVNGDWIGRKWEPGEFGNTFIGFSGGANSRVQFPILYALGNENQNYAIFIDSPYKMGWDFTNSQSWLASMWGDQLRYYIIAGDNIEQLRQKYLSLTGLPAMPPKKMLGLWVSEYGYKNWNEVNLKLDSLRNNNFPIDGFALDLYWFGGTKGMGSLTFDQSNFPNPTQNIKNYKDQGIGFIPIQEPYISETAKPANSNISDFQDLISRCYLVRKNIHGCDPSYFKETWWGNGGMIDWSNDNAADYWFQKKQVPLINMGLTNFWLDLNEPEMYDANAYYSGFIINGILKNRHADVANLYAFKWIESLDRGYSANKNNPQFQERPIYMSRAGAPGMQRFGGGMWSGDIGANLGGLRAHINNQTNVSLSGVDFYSADTGGFHRNVFDGSDINKLYTQWFANATVFDFPVRPHTWVGETPNSETAPSLIGDINSNRENILQRYSLAPYYYSLFYRAHLFGEAVTPPLVTLFQSDNNARTISSEKMIGKFLLGSAMSQYNDPIRRNIYLPEGRWLNYHTLDEVTATGKLNINYPVYLESNYKVPLFIREGAIIPQSFVDDKTMDIQGLRKDGSKINNLIVKVVPSRKNTDFTLYEDDGHTIDYKSSKYSQTLISQIRNDDVATIIIYATQGSYNAMPTSRKQSVEIATPNENVISVSLNGSSFSKCNSNLIENCWNKSSRNSVVAKLSSASINKMNTYTFKLQPTKKNNSQYSFTCLNSNTNTGESIYIIGNVPELGNWDTSKAIKLFPVEYPTWSRYITNISVNTNNIQWKCIKKNDSTNAVIQWQAGSNNSFNSPDHGYGGNVEGSF
jgi:alpha-glucosidase (family GH31 glycosyl hydrolase)